MNRLVIVVAVAILLIGLIPLGLNDTNIAVADTSIPDSEVTNSVSRAGNSSGGASIMITMTGMLNE